MADAILYSSLDVDGPGVPSGSASAVARLFSVLHACLVTGYGSKPGQGWTMVDNAGEAGFTLLSPDGVYLVVEQGLGIYNVRIYLAELLHAPFTYPPVGVNVRSQHYSADYASSVEVRHVVNIGSSSSAYATLWWTVVARGSQVLVFARAEHMNSTSFIERRVPCFFMGNLKLKESSAPPRGVQNFIFLGGTATTSTSTAGAVVYPFSGAFTRLRDLETGVVEVGALSEVNGDPWRYSASGLQAAPSKVHDIALVRSEVMLGNVGEIAYLPGVFFSSPVSLLKPSETLLALGRTNSWEALQAPLVISDSEYFLIPGPHGLLFISLNEADW